ncbi:MAG: protein RecA [Candidatus Binatia bacterium]|nr:MAG: protein RecA [Candidatus Binatia bacterium]
MEDAGKGHAGRVPERGHVTKNAQSGAEKRGSPERGAAGEEGTMAVESIRDRVSSGDGNRQRAVELAVSQIERQFGKGAIMKLGEEAAVGEIPVVSTGSLGLDLALGVGGLPRGRVVEIYGPESSGKTTLALHAVAEAQKQGGICVFIDAEHALDVSYAKKLGVKTEDLLISQPDYGEQALEIAETLVRSGAIDVMVIDSVAALVPRSELEGEMGEPQMGLQARLMSQALRKLTATISRSRTIVIFINQIRMKIGVMFGNPETTTGGNALKFYASCRLDIRRVGAIKQGDQVIGSRTKVRVVKNKVAPPFKEAEFDILYGTGISREGELVDLGAQYGILEKSGAWYSFDGERIGQGRENAKEYLAEHPEIARAIEEKLRARFGLGKPADGTGEKVAKGEIRRSK